MEMLLTLEIGKYAVDAVVSFEIENGDAGDWQTPPSAPIVHVFACKVVSITSATDTVWAEQKPDWFAVADKIAMAKVEAMGSQKFLENLSLVAPS
jgi:hypothetical protein